MIQDFIYEQIQADVECEFNRISVLIQGCQLQKHMVAAKRSSSDDTAHISDIIFHIYYAGWRENKITHNGATKYRTKLTEIGKKYGVGCITEEERIEIVKAVGLSKGHWFKCPNGHYYCIGECRAGGTGPADPATAGPKLQKPITQNFSLLFIYTLMVLYQQQYNLL